MLEVENYRRALHHIGYEHRGSVTEMPDLGGLHEPYPAYQALSAVNKSDKQSAMIHHWSPPHDTSPVPGSGAKSDEEDDDCDDDCRPFTPPPPRERLSYTRYQLEMLNGIYIRVRYPNSTQKQLIAKRVGITREQVKIWFQNRRRKDVVGNKKKDGSESDCSKSDQSDSKSDNGDNKSDSGDSDSGVGDEQSVAMVPDVVMKSVIAELHKFENDPLKSKKLKKKMKASRKKAKKVNTQQLKGMLLNSGYDMISPPNQVISSTPVRASGISKFNHSKDMSAFDTPREGIRPISYMDNYNSPIANSLLSSVPNRNICIGGMAASGRHSSVNASLGCDIPVLSDLLNYTKSTSSANSGSHESRMRESSLQPQHPTSPDALYYHQSSRNGHVESYGQPSVPMSSASLNRMYPYPLIAEHPMLFSSLRHTEPCRPQPQYPSGHHFSEDYALFQPYTISSLTNPYYNTQTSPVNWPHHSGHNTSDSNSSFVQI